MINIIFGNWSFKCIGFSLSVFKSKITIFNVNCSGEVIKKPHLSLSYLIKVNGAFMAELNTSFKCVGTACF